MREFRISSGTMTIRDTRSIKNYLMEINKYPVLTPNEESELGLLISKGDEKAKQYLVNHNLKFVVSVAKQYERNGIKLEDLINEGNIGLIKAANRFDPSRGFKFISYAVWHIRVMIISYIENNGKTIRLPSNKIDSNIKISKGITLLQQKLEREPSYNEIIEEFSGDFSIGDINFFINKGNTLTKSLDSKLNNKLCGGTLLDLIDDKNNEKTSHMLDSIDSKFRKEELLKQLSIKELTVIELFFGLNGKESINVNEISEILNLSDSAVYHIKTKALSKLKNKLLTQANWMIT